MDVREIMERVKAVPDTAFVQPSVALALVTEIERQASEIERLRGALQLILDHHPPDQTDAGTIARRALDEKEPD